MEKNAVAVCDQSSFVGGVDKVAVDIVNGLDKDRFDVTLLVLFRYDPGRYHIDPRVHVQPVFKTYFKGLSHLVSLLPQTWLYRRLVRGEYDYEIAFQAGVPTRMLSKSPSRAVKLAWMHGLDTDHLKEHQRFDKMVFISSEVMEAFAPLYGRPDDLILCYNPIDYKAIEEAASGTDRGGDSP